MPERETLADRVLHIARQEIGICESANENSGAPIEKYTGGRREPWCAHFVAWVFRVASRPLPWDAIPDETKANPIADVKVMEAALREAKWSVKGPGRAHICIRDGHCGIVERVAVTMFTAIEGNCGDCVARVTYRHTTAKHMGLRYYAVPDLGCAVGGDMFSRVKKKGDNAMDLLREYKEAHRRAMSTYDMTPEAFLPLCWFNRLHSLEMAEQNEKRPLQAAAS